MSLSISTSVGTETTQTDRHSHIDTHSHSHTDTVTHRHRHMQFRPITSLLTLSHSLHFILIWHNAPSATMNDLGLNRDLVMTLAETTKVPAGG